MSLRDKSEVDQKREDDLRQQVQQVDDDALVDKAGADEAPERPAAHQNQHFKRQGKKRVPGTATVNHHAAAPSSHVLADNHAMLKSINVNKMNHQYIQNLQKANMTLKCKIKEMREIEGALSLVKQQTSESEVRPGRKDNDGEWFDLEEADEELELMALGTIEEISLEAQKRRQERIRQRSEAKERREKEKNFYDRGRLGKSGSKKVNGRHSIVNQVRQDQERKNPQPRQARKQQAPPAHHEGQRSHNRYDDYHYHGYDEGYLGYDARWYDERYYGDYYYHDWYGHQENYLDRAQYERRGGYQRGRQQVNRRGRSYQNENVAPRHHKYAWVPKQATTVDDDRDVEVIPKKQNVNDDKRQELRPAISINDLKQRSKVLEEEKAQHRERVRAAAASKSNESPNKLTQVNSDNASVHPKIKLQDETEPVVLEVVAKIDKVKLALQQEDHEALKDVIYEHKMKEPVDAEIRSIQASNKTYEKLSQLKSELDNIIEKAAAKLVEAQSMQ